MRSTTRYISVGLVLGIAFAMLMMVLIALLGGIGARREAARAGNLASAGMAVSTATAPQMAPLALPSYTPTLPPSPATPANPPLEASPSPTPDDTLSALNGGGMVFSGPLSNAQQIALYRAALSYAQINVKDSVREAKVINAVGYGDPSNICGPLAIAILRDAGLVTADIIPHDFWLLNPVTTMDQRKLEKAFPPERFAHSKVATPLNKVDWQDSPLQPGDFLFIWHGSWGNFDHMLVVSRVDRYGRAYAVTNFGTAAGFMIAETLLYDPHDPTAGIFHTWTMARDQILGSTGFGGYDLWRALGPAVGLEDQSSIFASHLVD